MGEITIAVSDDVTMIRAVGVVTAEEVLNALRRLYADSTTKNEVWHLPTGSLTRLTSGDLRDVAQAALGYTDGRTGGKTAFVAPADLEFGTCRMLCAFIELLNIPVEVQAFRTLSEAARWMEVAGLPSTDESA